MFPLPVRDVPLTLAVYQPALEHRDQLSDAAA
jgi:hypothetical protein